MAEPVNGGGANRPPKKELSMELRLLIAFALMGVVLFTTPYFYKAPPKKSAAPATQNAKPAPRAAPAVAPAQPAPDQPAEQAPGPVTTAQAEETFALETDLFKIVFSNRGALVRSWMLKKFRDEQGHPLELVNTASKVELPFALVFPNQKPPVDVNTALFAAKPDPDRLGITYEFSDGHTLARKTFRFQKNSYLSQVSDTVTVDGKPVPNLISWRGGFGDMAVRNPAGTESTTHFDVSTGKLEKVQAKAAKDGPVTYTGSYSFAGIEDTYFAAVFLPDNTSNVQAMTFSDSVPTVLDKAEQPFAGTAVGGQGTNRASLFVGPKDIDILRTVNPTLEQLVDFGWFAFLAKPLFLLVNWTTDSIIHNYGWAIVVVTIVLNICLFPLKLSNMKSMKKMQALQPQIQAINEKYKGISMRDPKKAQQNQEVMDLYKKHGANPMGGCLPMIIQIPFFIAFYKVFSVSVEMRGANWLWVTDLSQPEHLPIKILPIVMIATQFWMQKMTPNPSADPNQQKMMLIMPLVFGFMFYQFPSGLVLYYLTSNLVGIAQQWFFNKTMTPAEALPAPVRTTKRNGKK